MNFIQTRWRCLYDQKKPRPFDSVLIEKLIQYPVLTQEQTEEHKSNNNYS